MLSCDLVDLLLLRHGIAVERHQGVDHPDRCLTPLGVERTFKVCCRLRDLGLIADRLYSSPYRRARETAELAVKSGLATEVELASGLEPGGDPWPLVQRLQGSCLLVGHEPDLSQLAAVLMGARSGGLRLRKAGLCHLRWDGSHQDPRGVAQLQGLLRPHLLLPGCV
ncbi:MAG: histidine phosphatase family protein [Synechococcus sp. BS30m-G30]|nr:histidine phosphatase family protein [Synechococcus sp. BS30m-G30]